jgi:tetratricopeptide (TPR) repeat protein
MTSEDIDKLTRQVLDITEFCNKVSRQAGICFKDKKFDTAIEFLQQGLKLDPYNPKLLRELGTTYYEQFADLKALEIFEKLVDLYHLDEDIKSLETIRKSVNSHYSMSKVYA